MKFKLAFYCIVLFLVSLQIVSGQNAESGQTHETYRSARPAPIGMQYSKIGDKRYITRFFLDDLKNSPSWDGKDVDKLPLTMPDAVKAGYESLKTLAADADDWKMARVELDRFELMEVKQRWLYKVTFENYTPDKRDAVIFLIKMDGSVIEPKPDN